MYTVDRYLQNGMSSRNFEMKVKGIKVIQAGSFLKNMIRWT